MKKDPERNKKTADQPISENGNLVRGPSKTRFETYREDIEGRFRRLFQNVREIAVQGYRLDGTTTYWNEASERLYGYSAAEAVGQNLIELIIPPEMKNEVIESMHHMTQSGKAIPSAELSLLKKDGSRISVYSNHAIVHLPDGTPELFCLDIDLSDRKRLEEERDKMATQKQRFQKVESLRRMAGAVAHHFNNQLSVVIGALELSLEDLPAENPNVQNLQMALQATAKAAEISRLMLTYLGQTIVEQLPIDISEICHRSLPLIRTGLPETIRLETDFLPASGPLVKGNESQIRQVLQNLITNAAESCKDSGTIRIGVRTVSAEQITEPNRFPIDWLPSEKAYIRVEIRDTGCGIPKEEIDQIFDPFYTDKFPGRGLGLPVVMGILRAHRGGATIESAPGHGTVFRFYLPVLRLKAAPPPEEKSVSIRLKPGITVLLVEDDKSVRFMSATLLKRLGAVVLEASDGIEALEIFGKYSDQIDCVLCDLTMPMMDGWQTLEALRTRSPDLPIILTSGYDEGHVMAVHHEVLPNSFLHKPFSREDLIAAINQAGVSKSSGSEKR